LLLNICDHTGALSKKMISSSFQAYHFRSFVVVGRML